MTYLKKYFSILFTRMDVEKLIIEEAKKLAVENKVNFLGDPDIYLHYPEEEDTVTNEDDILYTATFELPKEG